MSHAKLQLKVNVDNSLEADKNIKKIFG